MSTNVNLASILQDGPDNLLVVSDFDRTLTKAFVDGKATSLISVLAREKLMDEDYIQRAKAAYDFYRPIEIDETLSVEYRSQKMGEWWELMFSLLIEKKLSKELMRIAMGKSQAWLRDGVDKFLVTLHELNIPLLIFSGNALGRHSIEFFLEQGGYPAENVHIISNEFIWDSQGVAVDYQRPVVHVFNKDFSLVKNELFFEQIKNRPNVIALGDHLRDLDMIKNGDFHKTHSIGFLNENVDELRPIYSQKFNQLVEGDGSFDLVNQILGCFK